LDEARSDLYTSQQSEGAGLLSGWARRLMHQALTGISEGCLTLDEHGQRFVFGPEDAPLQAFARVHDARAYLLGVQRGEVGLGEAYEQGYWSSPDPVAVVRLAVRNMAAFEQGGGVLAKVGRGFARLRHLGKRNDKAGSRANIAAHYDLGNDFYRLFLDETLAYSCAMFKDPDQDLAEAQRNKFEHICQKLDLRAEDAVLEIGTGWGGFAAYAARTRGCRITTTTISHQQARYARALFDQEGLEDRITLLEQDYRDLEGRFDKIVSIEMFEAVGLKFYDTYFRALERLLRPGGKALIQTITMNESHWPSYIRGTDWIQQYIFPGAELGSVAEILRSLGRTGTLNLHHLEDIGLHYGRTLQLWRERFHAKLEEVRDLGYPESFLRRWDYYLAYCEGAFRERYIGDAQLLLTRRDAVALPGEPAGL